MCSKSKIGYYTWFILEDIRGILWIIMWGFPNDLYHLIHLFMVIWGMVCCWLSQWAWPHWPGSGSKPGAPGKKNIKIAGICGCSSPQNLRWWSMIYWSLLIHSWVKFTVPYLEMFLSPEWWTLATIHGPPGAGVSAAGDETMKLKQPRLEKQHWVTGRQPWQPRNRYLTYLK